MVKSNNVSRMPKGDNAKSKRKNSSKRVLKRSGRGGKDDDDSSVDSKGNMRNLIDYDFTSDSEDDTSVSTPSRSRTPRPKRKAAIDARKKIETILSKEQSKESTKEIGKKNKIIYKKEKKTKEVAHLTPSK